MSNLSIIPRPKYVSLNSEGCTLTSDSCIMVDDPNLAYAQYLQNRSSAATGYHSEKPLVDLPGGRRPRDPIA